MPTSDEAQVTPSVDEAAQVNDSAQAAVADGDELQPLRDSNDDLRQQIIEANRAKAQEAVDGSYDVEQAALQAENDRLKAELDAIQNPPEDASSHTDAVAAMEAAVAQVTAPGNSPPKVDVPVANKIVAKKAQSQVEHDAAHEAANAALAEAEATDKKEGN